MLEHMSQPVGLYSPAMQEKVSILDDFTTTSFSPKLLAQCTAEIIAQVQLQYDKCVVTMCQSCKLACQCKL